MHNPAQKPHDAQVFLNALHDVTPHLSHIGKMLIGIQRLDSTFPGPVGFDPGMTVPAEATHLNSAVFAPADNRGKRWRETGKHAKATLALILDDQGNLDKAKVTPLLTPTLKIRTSPGSEQWAYVYNEIVDPDAGLAMARAAALAGMSDAFIANRTHHWWRLPGSLPAPKIAQGRTEPAQLIDWTGETFSYADLAHRLGLNPTTVNVRAFNGSEDFDPDSGSNDPIWRWLLSRGYVEDGFDLRGFANVVCPNHAEHGDPNRPFGRYCPPNLKSDWAFTCHHEHCNGVKGEKLGIFDLRQWVAEQGGPTMEQTKQFADELREARNNQKASSVTEAARATLQALLGVAAPTPLPTPPKPATDENIRPFDPFAQDASDFLGGEWVPDPEAQVQAQPAATGMPFLTPMNTLALPKPAKIIADQLLPAAGCVLQGADGIAKSTMMILLACHVITGRPITDRHVVRTPGPVVIFSKEDDNDLMHDRTLKVLRDNGFSEDEQRLVGEQLYLRDLEYIPMKLSKLVASDRMSDTISPTPFAEEIIPHLKAVKPSLIVFDPMAAFGAGEKHVNDNEMELMLLANRIARATGACCLMVHHVSQEAARSGQDDQFAGRGGSALSGQARGVLTMVKLQRQGEVEGRRAFLGIPACIDDDVILQGRVAYINVAKLTAQRLPPARLFIVRGDDDAPFKLELIEGVSPDGRTMTAIRRELKVEKKANADAACEAMILATVRRHNDAGIYPTRNAVATDTDLQTQCDFKEGKLQKVIRDMVADGRLVEVDGMPTGGRKGKGLWCGGGG